MCSCHSIQECCVMFSGVKLSMGSFVLSPPLRRGGSFEDRTHEISGI